MQTVEEFGNSLLPHAMDDLIEIEWFVSNLVSHPRSDVGERFLPITWIRSEDGAFDTPFLSHLTDHLDKVRPRPVAEIAGE